jgi:hypothetical protein
VTYLRVRITAQSGAMTTSHSTGYFTNGEVEDYRVLVDNYPLSTITLSYTATLLNEQHGLLKWQVQEDGSTQGYEIQKSRDGFNWDELAVVGSDGHPGLKNYSYVDMNISYGKTFYRLRFIGNNKFSEIRTINRMKLDDIMVIRPNPVSDRALVDVESENRSVAEITLFSITGKQVYHKLERVEPGKSTLELAVSEDWPNGSYILRVHLNHQLVSRKLIIHR